MNFGTPVPLLIGIVLILGAVALFFLDKLKPGYGRDSDKVYAILWLISGVFLLGHLTMELLASFQQLIMAGMLIAVTLENIYSRSPKEDRYVSQGAGGGQSREDYYRPSRSRDYRENNSRMNVRAELDDDIPYRPRFPEDRRMLRGRDEVEGRSGYYGGAYADDRYPEDRGYSDRSMMGADRSVERLNPGSDRIRRRRPKATDSAYRTAQPSRGWDESATGYAANSGGYSAHTSNYGNASSSGHPSANGRDDDNYVDYKPIDYPNDESGRPSSDSGSRY